MLLVRYCALFGLLFLAFLHQANAQAFNGKDIPSRPQSLEKRVALVIGNSTYATAPLKNPVNDARDMAQKLKELGFDVVERENLTLSQLGPTLREFKSKLTPGSVALFFYAGHGIQVRGNNFLPVVDAEIAGEEDVSMQSLDVAKVLDAFAQAQTRLNLIFLDACRNNPYARSYRSVETGLAKLDAPSGTLISFATRPGKVASDGSGKNGLYTEKLLLAMNEPGLPIEATLKRVVGAVKAASNGTQEPWMEGSIDGDFYFIPPFIQAGRNSSSGLSEVRLWAEALSDGRRAYFEAYLKQFPKGKNATEARTKLKAIDEQEYAELEAVRAAALVLTEKLKSEQLRQQRDDWAKASAADTVAAYSEFLRQYPSGKYETLAQSARQRAIDRMQDMEERELWSRAENGTIADADNYLKRFPRGRYATQVTDRLKELVNEENERKRPGRTFRDCSNCPEMIVVPTGNFHMGISPTELVVSRRIGMTDLMLEMEQPRHLVAIQTFASGKYPVTKGQFAAFVKATNYVTEAEKSNRCFGHIPEKLRQGYAFNWRFAGIHQEDDHPVICISWNDAQAYVDWLSGNVGKKYRLLSESEREYVTRAGTQGSYWTGDSIDPTQANFGSSHVYNSPMLKVQLAGTTPVGTFNANPFGLFDVHGNVWEWTQDCWHENYVGAPLDGSPWSSNCEKDFHTLRGGAWNSLMGDLRSSGRERFTVNTNFGLVGFRVATNL